MEFEIRSFKKLLGMHFNIPNYQRGYRWEEENVKALLNDIQEFANNPAKETGEFYCLQPVVVRQNKYLSEKEGHEVYDVLDGQQRLTTLWLILHASDIQTLWKVLDSGHKPTYDLRFESRTDLLKKAIDPFSDKYENIDLFYLKSACISIKEWCEQETSEPLKLLNALVPKVLDANSNDVRVIWYEFDKDIDELAKQSSSIKVFSRLNYGKIALTETELIKSLLLQNDIYPIEDATCPRAVMKERLFRISTEWDDIEKGLHDKSLWGMLTPTDYSPGSHIELILKFVAEQIQKDHTYQIIDSQRREFHIIAEYLGANKVIIPVDYAQKVQKLWNKIRDAYNAIRNWHSNPQSYHLIGLLVLLKGGSNPLPLMQSLFDEYCKRDKTSFEHYLKSEIGNLIKIKDTATNEATEDVKPLNLKDLIYNQHNPQIVRILQAVNIYLHLCNSQNVMRFDFKAFKQYKVTSLEHIHPQHLDFGENIKQEDLESWAKTTKATMDNNPEYKDEKVKSALDSISKILSDKDAKHRLNECQKYVEQIDDFFDCKAGIDDGHMHTLYNLALVDKDTNAALSNNLIDTKRHILQQRQAAGKTYIPIATEYVFNKHFSERVSDMKFWTKNDREAYFLIIEKAYNYFLNPID